jgi:hypothetical protein
VPQHSPIETAVLASVWFALGYGVFKFNRMAVQWPDADENGRPFWEPEY